MNPRTADRLIKAGKPVNFYNSWTKETGTGTPISRTRWNISIVLEDGHVGVFDRGETEVIVVPA